MFFSTDKSVIDNDYRGKIDALLSCVNKNIKVDGSIKKNKNGKETYCVDLYEFHTKEECINHLLYNKLDFAFLYKFFSIESINIESKLVSHEYNNESKGIIIAKTNLDKLKLLFSLKKRYIFYIKENDEKHEINIDDELIYVDCIQHSILFKIDHRNIDNVSDEALNDNLYLNCNVYGLPNYIDVPLWVENILYGVSLYRAGDIRMGFFLTFTALDNLIESMREELIKVISNKKVEGDSIRIESLSKLIDCYKYFSDNKHELINEKLKSILSFLLKDDEKNEYYNKIIDGLNKACRKRNDIAHGVSDYKYEEKDYENLLTNILKLLYLIKFHSKIDEVIELE